MAEITVNAAVKELDAVTAFVEEQMEGTGCSMKTIIQLNVAVEEIFVNIAHYAYPQGGGTAEIVLETVPGQVTITFTDSGLPFNPLDYPEPDISLDADERDIGGLGILMVRKSMNEVTYARENGRNVLTIVKKY